MFWKQPARSEGKTFVISLNFRSCFCFLPHFSSYSFVFEQTMKVFNKHCGHRDNLQWILELLGRIQVNLLEGKYNIEQAIFLCDVFMLAVVIFSGRSVFFCKTESLMNETKALFPQSVCVLAKRQTSNCMGQVSGDCFFWFVGEMQFSGCFCRFWNGCCTWRTTKRFLSIIGWYFIKLWEPWSIQKHSVNCWGGWSTWNVVNHASFK